jgi:hypothetical protein
MGLLLAIVGGLNSGWAVSDGSKACATCWHAHPFIKSSHVAGILQSILPDISAVKFLLADAASVFGQHNAELKCKSISREEPHAPQSATRQLIFLGSGVCNNIQSILGR